MEGVITKQQLDYLWEQYIAKYQAFVEAEEQFTKIVCVNEVVDQSVKDKYETMRQDYLTASNLWRTTLVKFVNESNRSKKEFSLVD